MHGRRGGGRGGFPSPIGRHLLQGGRILCRKRSRVVIQMETESPVEDWLLGCENTPCKAMDPLKALQRNGRVQASALVSPQL